MHCDPGSEMLTVGRLARKYGLSRSTLLYYDSIGLLSPESHHKGEYRLYTSEDEDKLKAICRYREAGISLKDIQAILNSDGSRFTSILEQRFAELNTEIRQLHEQQRIIAGLLKNTSILSTSGIMTKELWTTLLESSGFSEEDMRSWHIRFERSSPEKHLQFLEHLQISDDEIRRIRSWAKESGEKCASLSGTK